MSLFKRKAPSGILYVSKSDIDDAPSLFLEALEHPSEIANKRYVTFKVKVLDKNTPK